MEMTPTTENYRPRRNKRQPEELHTATVDILEGRVQNIMIENGSGVPEVPSLRHG